MVAMQVEIWSDIACPWCYLGKRRFSRAVEQFPHADALEVTWRSFQLAPDAPQREDRPHDALLAATFGISRAQVAVMHARLVDEGGRDGVTYAFDRVRMENSFDAHRLIHLAAARGRAPDVVERLFAAYFTNGESVGDRETLVRVAREVGIDEADARGTLESNAIADAVHADQRRALEIGITGVPFIAIDEKYAISGAQPADAMLVALHQAWDDRDGD